MRLKRARNSSPDPQHVILHLTVPVSTARGVITPRGKLQIQDCASYVAKYDEPIAQIWATAENEALIQTATALCDYLKPRPDYVQWGRYSRSISWGAPQLTDVDHDEYLPGLLEDKRVHGPIFMVATYDEVEDTFRTAKKTSAPLFLEPGPVFTFALDWKGGIEQIGASNPA